MTTNDVPPTAYWPDDPVDLALQASSLKRETDAFIGPYCLEAGRRLLLAELQFNEWVLRRFERVQFERERSVSRRITIEFTIRPDTPIFAARNQKRYYLVPLSIMRRTTMLNLEIKDEAGALVQPPGLRFTQRMDASILLAAAAATEPSLVGHPALKALIERIISGESDDVDDAYREFTDGIGVLVPLAGPTLFAATLGRLYRNFTLNVLLDVDDGTHRTLTLGFDEPTEWKLQRPKINDLNGLPGGKHYEAGGKVPFLQHAARYGLAQIGLNPTRLRFQIPAAENAASYHFEVESPLGIRIMNATLLAGRPNEPDRRISFDRVVGHAAVIGLHAVEVPNGSLCRVQLDLRVPRGGWLDTLLVSCLVIVGVLASVGWHLHTSPTAWTQDQLTNIIVLLVTASAGTVTLVAQRDFHGLAASIVTHLRAIGAIAISLPIIAAAYLVYEGGAAESQKQALTAPILTLLLVAASLCLLVLTAWILSIYGESVRRAEASIWNQTVPRARRDTTVPNRRSARPLNYLEGVNRHRFHTPAIGISSAEGWHEQYTWTDKRQRTSINDLAMIMAPCPSRSTRAGASGVCPCLHSCSALSAPRASLHCVMPTDDRAAETDRPYPITHPTSKAQPPDQTTAEPG